MVTGSVVATPGSVDELLALTLAHVRRSRTEPPSITIYEAEPRT